ncbi:4982_t:CDS:1 [Funneliformis mosseae]|uniref:4982_t:CDS:1 n=1 Tax=Funneliformis mosseae TaxID=27381 RepID=A0A9N9FGC4_FUNMO|nr:4982_t:CDS:1 [Funneliformis mosseae]
MPEELFDSTIVSLLNGGETNVGESDIESEKVKIESSIITFQQAELIIKWIEKLEVTDEIIASYEFKLLARERGVITGPTFHECCDDKFPTISIVKVEGNNEILGGYNPIAWSSGIFSSYDRTRESFIFSFKDNDISNHILSRVTNEQRATYNRINYGPTFGYSDLTISQIYGNICIKSDYENSIRESRDNFDVEICEIYLIIKN